MAISNRQRRKDIQAPSFKATGRGGQRTGVQVDSWQVSMIAPGPAAFCRWRRCIIIADLGRGDNMAIVHFCNERIEIHDP
jgi:hypothetical protein